MAILIFQHGDDVPAGRFGLTLRDHGFKLDIRRIDLAPGSRHDAKPVPPDFDDIEGIVVLGGEQNVTDIAKYPWMQAEAEYIREAHLRALPVVGICLGAQLIAHALGGKVDVGGQEWGMHRVQIGPAGQTETILSGIPWNHPQFQAHNQEIKELPAGAALLASSKACKVQAFKMGLRTYGFQFHFECDRPGIERIMQYAPGGAPADLTAQLDEHYSDFARLANRLCVNIASYIFPLQRKRQSA